MTIDNSAPVADLEGLDPIEQLEAYAAKGDILKFKELANTLPVTPAVRAWLSRSMQEAARGASVSPPPPSSPPVAPSSDAGSSSDIGPSRSTRTPRRAAPYSASSPSPETTPRAAVSRPVEEHHVESCAFFTKKIAYLLGPKYYKTVQHRQPDDVAASVAAEIKDKLDTMLAWAQEGSYDTKRVCLQTTTELLSRILDVEADGLMAFPLEPHAAQWGGYVRVVMETFSDVELKRLRRTTGYGKTLWDLGEDVKQIPPSALRENPIFWPRFKKDTIKYFNTRTKGFDKEE